MRRQTSLLLSIFSTSPQFSECHDDGTRRIDFVKCMCIIPSAFSWMKRATLPDLVFDWNDDFSVGCCTSPMMESRVCSIIGSVKEGVPVDQRPPIDQETFITLAKVGSSEVV